VVDLDVEDAFHPYTSTALIYNQVFPAVVSWMSSPISGSEHLTSTHYPFPVLGTVPQSSPPTVILVPVNLSPQQSCLFLILTFSTTDSPPDMVAFHHYPTPLLVIAVLAPLEFKALLAGKLPE